MKLYFKTQGEGTPVIILHGLLGTSDNWYSFARRLSETHQVIIVDQRNHGRSPHSNQFSYTLLAEDVNELMQDLNIRQASIIGHSMGGKAAMSMAQQYPHRVKKLVVVDMSPRKYQSPYFKEIIEILLKLDVANANRREDVDKMTQTHIPDAAMRGFLLKNLRRGENGGFVWKPNLPVLLKHVSEISSEVSYLDKFSKPALFVRGGKSDYIEKSDENLIRMFFPKAKIETIPQAGHWVHAEAPDAFFESVKKFL